MTNERQALDEILEQIASEKRSEDTHGQVGSFYYTVRAWVEPDSRPPRLWQPDYDEELYWLFVEAGRMTVADLLQRTGCPSEADYWRVREELLPS